jgi:DNA-binding GntR family transcriptional regulator
MVEGQTPVRPLPTTSSGEAPYVPVMASVHTIVRDAMRRDILHGRLSGGSRLHQTQLAQQYDVSITPVREALRDLATEGLVDFTTYSGAVVHRATMAELEQVYRMRAALSPLAVEEGVPLITDAELAEADSLIRHMETTSSRDEWIENNRRLHRMLDSASRNRILAETLGRLADLSTLYVNISIASDPVRRPGADDEHRELLNAYRARDVDAATRISLQHFGSTLERSRVEFHDPEPGSSSAE